MHAILVLHNLLRWAVLLFGVLTVMNGLSGYSRKRIFTESDNKSNLLFMICCDIQLLLGIILYIRNDWFSRLQNFSAIKSDAVQRFFAMEHMSMMILAWILVHVGRVMVKRASTDQSKHLRMIIYFGLALLLILASIPWPFRTAIARPLLQWF